MSLLLLCYDLMFSNIMINAFIFVIAKILSKLISMGITLVLPMMKFSGTHALNGYRLLEKIYLCADVNETCEILPLLCASLYHRAEYA